MENYRISANIGKEQKINFELKQDFNFLQILSLKLTQKDVYTSLCSDYGVVCGRISVNNGFGVPNARVSIFIPLNDNDINDPIISELYPYQTVSDINEDGYRYNLLPERKQHGGHEPTGTFPDQLDILTREEVLEVYEKYYKYTVKTNNAGDFMIWGVPIGEQTIHVDLDLSDMGCFSLRPDDFIRKGYGVDDFKSPYEFKSSSDLDSLPQIKTFDKSIEVYPFWGSEDLCEIGITRTDFDLSSLGVVVEPKAYLIGGSFTDSDKLSINKNCIPSKNMGAKCSLNTQSGKIEAIRFTTYYDESNRPTLEEYRINDDINEDGSFMFAIPMNMDYVYTNEFGENEYTNNPNKGIPTSACYRFRFTLNDGNLERVRMRGSYLVPNIREFYTDDDESLIQSRKSYAWSTNYDDYPDNSSELILNSNDGFYYPQDYFYRLQYGKVYTVSSFQNILFKTDERILSIKDVVPENDKDCSDNVLTMPVNMGMKNRTFNFNLLLAIVIAFVQFIYSSVLLIVFEFVSTFLKDLADLLYSFKISKWRPLHKASERVRSAAYEVQSAGQIVLPLVIYDNCDLCSSDEENVNEGFDIQGYCKIGEILMNVYGDESADTITFEIITISEDTGENTSYIDNGSARECDQDEPLLSGCCGSYKITDSGFNQLNVLTYPNANGVDYPRFFINLSTGTNSALTDVAFYISENHIDYEQFEIVNLNNGHYGFIFNSDQIENLFGIENGAQYFEDNKILDNSVVGSILDRQYPKPVETAYEGINIEEGCEMYDTLYNEDTITEYIWIQDGTNYEYPNEPEISQQLTPAITPGYYEQPKEEETPGSDWSIGASVWYKYGQERLPRIKTFEKIPDQKYNRKTKTGYSEFRDGVFTIVPSSDGLLRQNRDALREWYRRQLIGLNFCGGIVDFSFMDNWLSGSLYFFHFKAKIKDDGDNVKVCNDIVRYIPDHERFYYKSCPYKHDPDNPEWGTTGPTGIRKILHPTTIIDLGPRDEFIKEICVDPYLDPNCSVSRSIGPTSFKSFGELLAFAINYKMDVNNADLKVDDFFTNQGFGDYFNPDNVPKFAQFLNGDIIQLLSINSEAGIEGFDLQNAKYIAYSISSLDPETYPDVFKNGTDQWGPTPITLKYEDDGVRIRGCLNAPGYLTEASQKVPFYLWDKRGTGFGSYETSLKNDQRWNYETIVVDYLQGMSGSTYGYKFNNGIDQFLLPPISYDFTGQIISGQTGLSEEFDVVIDPTEDDPPKDDDEYKSDYGNQHHGFSMLILTSGTTIDPITGRLYIRLGDTDQWSDMIEWDTTLDYSIFPTLDPYSTETQILSTPFLFYFGLRPGKTGLDKLIERFGPKGAFPSAE